MYLERLAPPSDLPVTLAEAKAQLRIFSMAEDPLISGLIATAAALLEGRSGMLGGRALVTQKWRTKFDCFSRRMELPLPPLQSVEAITYLDGDGNAQALDPSLYVVVAHTHVGYVRLARDAQWPAALRDENAVTIDFTCGYGAPAAVPMTLKQAMHLLVNHWYFNRGEIGALPAGAQLAVEALLSGERLMTF